MCHWSDVSPIPDCFHLFPIYPHVSYSPRLPLSHARVFRRVLPAFDHSPYLELRQVPSSLYSDSLFSSKEE